MKYSFFNDYSEGAHPLILQKLAETNLTQQAGYGLDTYSKSAISKLQKAMDRDDIAIHFVSGGTQANQIVLGALLKPYQSVIAAESGHISVHEAGAIELTGHKINTVATSDGKLTPQLIQPVIDAHTDEHMVQPKVVFISDATEVGTIYSYQELQELSAYCREHDLYLYMDGARLGSALTSHYNDLNLRKISQLVDVFYIGGTKNGALMGEAIVIANPKLQQDFRFHLKQRGALLAKGRALGLQFEVLFSENLYFELAKHANKTASQLSAGISALGYKFLTDSPTNQIFPILPTSVIAKLEEAYGFYVWSKVDDQNSAIRLVTSWATDEVKVQEFLNDLELISKK